MASKRLWRGVKNYLSPFFLCSFSASSFLFTLVNSLSLPYVHSIALQFLAVSLTLCDINSANIDLCFLFLIFSLVRSFSCSLAIESVVLVRFNMFAIHFLFFFLLTISLHLYTSFHIIQQLDLYANAVVIFTSFYDIITDCCFVTNELMLCWLTQINLNSFTEHLTPLLTCLSNANVCEHLFSMIYSILSDYFE